MPARVFNLEPDEANPNNCELHKSRHLKAPIKVMFKENVRSGGAVYGLDLGERHVVDLL